MNARRLRRARLSHCVPPAPNRAMERRAQEKDWRLTDRYERRIPTPLLHPALRGERPLTDPKAIAFRGRILDVLGARDRDTADS